MSANPNLMNKSESDNADCLQRLVRRLRSHIAMMAPHQRERLAGALLIETAAELEKMRGVIARNAMQRLKGEDATELYITADDIKYSLEVLYSWQADKSPNGELCRAAKNQ